MRTKYDGHFEFECHSVTSFMIFKIVVVPLILLFLYFFPSFGVYGVYGMCLCISSSKIMLYVTVCVILLCWTKSVSAFDITNVQESGSSLNVIDHSIWGNRQYWGFENMICKFSLSFSHSLFFFCTPELLPKQ